MAKNAWPTMPHLLIQEIKDLTLELDLSRRREIELEGKLSQAEFAYSSLALLLGERSKITAEERPVSCRRVISVTSEIDSSVFLTMRPADRLDLAKTVGESFLHHWIMALASDGRHLQEVRHAIPAPLDLSRYITTKADPINPPGASPPLP
jgi:hypothetical protein